MVVVRKKPSIMKLFANMITIICLHLMGYFDLMEYKKNTCKAWRNTHNAHNAFAT